jgi:outer membrane protein assembly factor BamB
MSLSMLGAAGWSHQAGKDVKWYKVSHIGTLVYATDDALVSLDPESGRELWRRDDLKKVAEFNVEEVNGAPLLFVALNEGKMQLKTKLVALDLLGGETAWESEELKGHMVDVFPVYEENLVVLVKTLYSVAKSELHLTAFDLVSGDKRFETEIKDKADLYKSESSGKMFMRFDLSGHAEPVAHEGVLYLSYAGLHAVDIKTGAVKWAQKFDVTEKSFKKTNAAPVVVNGMVISSAKGVLRAFDRETGAEKWKSPDFGAGVAEFLVDDGVLYGRMGGAFQDSFGGEWQLKKPLGLVALDVNSGKVLWRYDKAKDGLTNMALMPDGDTVLVADAKTLIGLSKTGDELFRKPVEFKTKGAGAAATAMKVGLGGFSALKKDKSAEDAPVAIVTMDNGTAVVRGKQHILAFNPAAKDVAWATEYEAPGVAGWQKIAMAGIQGFAYTVNTAKAANSYRGTSENRWANQQRTKNIADYNRFASKRFSATTQTGQFVYILTTVGEGKQRGPGIVGINLATGEMERSFYFGEKQPDYQVDEQTGMVFRLIKGKELTGAPVA